MSVRWSEISAMSAGTEAAELVRKCAEPIKLGDNIKTAIGRAGARLGFSLNRTRRIWYREARRINAEEMDRLRERATQIEKNLTIQHLLALRESVAKAGTSSGVLSLAALDEALRELGA